MTTYNIRKLRSGRIADENPATWVGQIGTIFYNEATGALRISDGVTPGGVNLPFAVASTTEVGGIKAGPGANVSIDGTLTINTAGLPLSIGNLSIVNTTISTVNADQDLILATNGTANVNVVGEFQVFKTDGNISSRRPEFHVARSGIVTVLVNTSDTTGAMEIVGSTTGNIISPGTPGAMLHVTGNYNLPNRFYLDGNNNYVSLVARRWNGNVATPTQVLAGEDVLRINSTAATTSGVGNVATAQIRMTALENQTPTAQGSEITFTVTPVGSSAASRVDVANVTVAEGVWATKFTTPGNVSAASITATGTISSTGNLSAGNISTGQITATGAITSGDGISDSLGLLRSIPQNSKNTGYTLQATDNGQMINITAGNVTIPGGVFNSPYGQTVSIYNNQNFSNTIVQGSGVTLRLAGTAATGNRTLARYGVATVVCVAANTFVISGAGIT